MGTTTTPTILDPEIFRRSILSGLQRVRNMCDARDELLTDDVRSELLSVLVDIDTKLWDTITWLDDELSA